MKHPGLLITALLMTSFLFGGCASKFIVKSEPTEAEVFIRNYGSDEKKSLGKTPISLSQAELQEKTKIDPSSGEFFELIVEMKDYQTERMLIPSSRLGHLETTVYSKLKSGQNESRIAQALLQHLFNAQKLANQQEFERAQIELDKALEMDESFTRAMSLRGSIYFLQKRYDESLKWFEKALSVDPKFDDSLKMITQIRKIQGIDRTPSEAEATP